MRTSHTTLTTTEWKKGERAVFRVSFIYFMLQALPLDLKYYRNIFEIDWSHFQYRDLFYIARYTPQFFSSDAGEWGLGTLQDWAMLFLIALIGAAIWGYYDRSKKDYSNLYYLLRVVLRYRLAIAVIAYGFIKLFPLQIPYPSLSLKNTNYGDLTNWRIAYLAYGAAPSFEAFLGGVEIFAGLLLLFRKTASLGAAIVLGFVGNVFLSNLGYNGGEAIYCLYLLTMAAVLVFYDVRRWHKVIMLGKPSTPNAYRPPFFTKWVKGSRLLLRTAFVFLLFGVYSYYAYALYEERGYQYPKAKGLTDAAGLYNVRVFKINGQERPYSLTDSIRWQNVVFEEWPTISIRTYQPIRPQIANTEEIYASDIDRNFESTGSNGRWFYRYTVDTTKQILYLQNKNKNYNSERFALHYSRPNSRRIDLSGTNEKGDSIYVVLDKLKKIYLLDESYQIPQKRSVFD